jgi:chemotaxis signal transduction protein
MFQVGARVYAAEVHDVRRIGAPRHAEPHESFIATTVLGDPFARDRGIVVTCGQDGEHTLLVDRVIGVCSVPESDLQPLPPLATRCLLSSAITGLLMLDGAPVPLVDLPTLIREQRESAAAAPPVRPPDA